MGKDFDEVHLEDREFTISGQQFHWRLVGWEEQTEWIEDAVSRVREDQEKEEAARAEAEKAGKEYEEPDEPLQVSMERAIKRILHFVEEEERERLDAVLRSKNKPVSILQLTELGNWLQEVQTERPTNPPADSSDGAGTTAVTSSVG